MKNSVAITLGFIFCVACGGTNTTKSGRQQLPFENVSAELVGATCEAAFRCLPLEANVLGSVEKCEAVLGQQVAAGSFDAITRAEEEGRIVYDGASAKNCIDEIASRGCEGLDLRQVTACNQTFRGTAEHGQGCTLDEECVGESFCAFDETCPGTCTPYRAAGELCEVSEECEGGLECFGFPSRCGARAKKGESCDGEATPPCELTLLCLGEDSRVGVDGRCFALDEGVAKEGEACAFRGANIALCEEGLSCRVEGVTAEEDFLSFCRQKVGTGEECGFAIPWMCPAGEVCAGIDDELVGICTKLPEAGENCLDEVDFQCAVGTACVDGTCEAARDNGAGCESETECKSGFCLDGVCTPEIPCD